MTNLQVELGPKQVEVMHELLPSLSSIGLLINPTNSAIATAHSRSVQLGANRRNLQLYIVQASTGQEIDSAFAELLKLHVGGLLTASDALFSSHINQLAELSLRKEVPTIYHFREFTAAGGLVSYGGSNAEASIPDEF